MNSGVRPDPKTVEGIVMAMALQTGRAIGMVYDNSPEAASNVLEAATARMFEEAAWSAKYLPFAELDAATLAKRKGTA